MNDARAIVDADKRIAALQEVNKTIAADYPVRAAAVLPPHRGDLQPCERDVFEPDEAYSIY